MAKSGQVLSDQDLVRIIQIDGNNFRKGVTAPTDVTIGTTPTIPALHFDATAELASLFKGMSPDWDKTQDCQLLLLWSLADTEVNAETLDITCDYVATKQNTTGAGIAKTSTQVTGQVTVTTANGLAVGDLYIMSITLAQADATNGFGAGDDTVGFAVEIHLTNLTGVAQVDLIRGAIQYKALY